MSEVLKEMKERRSIRKYKADMVPQEILDQIIEAGLYAASGKGTQNTIIIQVTKKELRDEIAEMNRKIGGWEEGFDPFYGAPAMLIVLARKDWPTGIYDGSLVMGNLMLAAHDLGIGSCWIHRAKEEFETEWGKELLKSLGISGEYVGIGHCALGYADGETPKAAKRKVNRVFSKGQNKYQIHQQKKSSSVLCCQIRKPPYISKSYRTAGCRKNEPNVAGKSAS